MEKIKHEFFGELYLVNRLDDCMVFMYCGKKR